MIRQPMGKDEVTAAIERRGCAHVPVVFHKWWGDGLEERYGAQIQQLNEEFPDDIVICTYNKPGEGVSSNANPDYRWGYKADYSDSEKHSIDPSAVVLLPDWAQYDQFLANMPDPNEPDSFDGVKALAAQAGGRYKLGHWWNMFHERFWYIRGMENLMLDYYDHMDELKDLGKRLVRFYQTIIDRYAELGFDGILSSDDLGHQTGPMMSPAVFRELYLPLYQEFVDYVHGKGMHFFLHSCGDNTALMDDIIASGIDVFHPIQKGCMDLAATVKRFGDRISFLYGIDVQHLIPLGTADEVRTEIREVMNTMYRPHGGFLIGAGNGIMGDTPIENLRAMLEEICTFRYKA